MFIQHVCISVKDIDRSVAFYRDVMGFMQLTPAEHMQITPYGQEDSLPDSDFTYTQAGCGDLCFHVKNVDCCMAVMLVDPQAFAGGGCIEIQCLKNPPTTYVEQNYFTTGIKEICFSVETAAEVYEWEKKLIEAGVEMRGPVWTTGSGKNGHKTILFHDPDGNILQIAAAEGQE
jgi:catechol 2,3-dioxygenase-like lactoylglutathione lyase family enzyme